MTLFRGHFGSFASISSIIGLALSVAVLIAVMSVMNGFTKEISNKFLNLTPHLHLQSGYGHLYNNIALVKNISEYSGVKGVSPYIEGHGMLMHSSIMRPVAVRGIDLDTINSIFPVDDLVSRGSIYTLDDINYGIVLGQELANSLNLDIGDKVTFVLPTVINNIVGSSPKLKTLTVVGTFSSGYRHDNNLALINLATARKLFNVKDDFIHGLQISIEKPMQAPAFKLKLNSYLDNKYWITDWTDQLADKFKAAKTEKSMLFMVLLFIVAVFAFNLISALIILIGEKKKDIAILRAMGASRKMIMQIFFLHGLVTSIIGTILGAILGIIISLNVTSIANFIERVFNFQFFDSNLFYIDYLPSCILYEDIVQVVCWALVLSVIATIYPAYKATKIKVVKVLHNG